MRANSPTPPAYERQGFLLAMDWVMKQSTADNKNGIQWTMWTQLNYLDFVDDLALLSHTQKQNTSTITANSACLGLKIHRGKSKVLRVNSLTSTW